MCGDLDEEGGPDAAFDGFREHAAHLVAATRRRRAGTGGGIEAHLDRLFADILARLLEEDTDDGVHSSQRLALAPVVLARLAGLVAGHAPLAEDPLRRTLEALMTGYAEPGAFLEANRDAHYAHHDHHHHDHHHHDHHGHGHHHHHEH